MDKHLKSADFFDVEKYPKANFLLTSLTPVAGAKPGEYTHTAKGKLTIKDKTNDISFDVVLKKESGKLACTGTAVVDRSKFDVKHGSKTFFADIGDKMIYDEFTLKFKVAAIKK